MKVEEFIDIIGKKGAGGFFTGVPDSQLKPLCNYLFNTYGIAKEHIIAANEGNATALAAGYHLATGNIPCVYLQNSGLGNITNPVSSLLNAQVYGIPCLFVVGWRGEPHVPDEPQHRFQGEITLDLLSVLGIEYMVIDKDTRGEALAERMTAFANLFKSGKSAAIVVKKGALTYQEKVVYANGNTTSREDIIRLITEASGEDIIVSTTGKTSRELFEIRKQKGQSHKRDFLTVGSMGHSSSIALGIALSKPGKRIWCLDGDGAALMHMGALALVGSRGPANYVHVVINNEAHESVGGQPTVAGTVDFQSIAKGCGYQQVYRVDNLKDLQLILAKINQEAGPIFLEVKAAIGSREDLGRPTSTPQENKIAFMEYLRQS